MDFGWGIPARDKDKQNARKTLAWYGIGMVAGWHNSVTEGAVAMSRLAPIGKREKRFLMSSNLA